MIQEKENGRMAESQKGHGIKEDFNLRKCGINAISAILPAGKGTQHLGRDGPPGWALSPGSILRNGMHPTHSTFLGFKERKSITAMNINNLIYTKIQFITNINFLQS